MIPSSLLTRRFQRLIAILILLFTLTPSLATLDRSQLTTNQQTFLKAYDAIKANDRPLIATYKQQLANYTLYHYLPYLDYMFHLENTPAPLIETYLNNTPNSPLPAFLKRKWLYHLGKTQQWSLFLKHHQDSQQDSTPLQCYALRAKIAKAPSDSMLNQVKQLWVKSFNNASACQPLDQYLRQNKALTGSMVWKKIVSAMQKGKLSLAKQAGRDLSKLEQNALDYWIKVYQTPDLVQRAMPAGISPVIRQQIFKQGVLRYAYTEPQKALALLGQRASQYGLNHEEVGAITKTIGLRLAYRYDPTASETLDQIDQASQDHQTIEWQLQLTIRNGDWLRYLDLFERMPMAYQHKKRWQYWRARSLAKLNRNNEAQEIYQRLAKQRNFYGFLSADILKQPCRFNPKPSQTQTKSSLQKKYPQLRIIEELLAIDWKISLKREWYHLLEHTDEEDFEAIANLMSDWNQHHLAIQTISKVKKWDDLTLRFPTPYKEPVMQAANKNTIDPAWVYGVMRRESAFSSNISSSAGAIGLMQLMPTTARYIGQKIGFKKWQYNQLTRPNENISLGSAYLSYLHQKYNGSRILATAAYNAGPKRVDQWILQHQSMAADRWIDTIPFSETRAYVKAVLEYTTIFKSILNQKYDRLENFMHPIGGK